MYFCPKGCQIENVAPFEVTEHVHGIRYLKADGHSLGFEQVGTERASQVRCSGCGALAEWRDEKQLEMFGLAPELFG